MGEDKGTAVPGNVVRIAEERIKDHLGRIVFANRRLHELTGHAARSLDGRPVETLVPEAQRSQHRQDMDRYVHDPSPRTMGVDRRTSCRRADGSTFAVDIALSPLPHGDGAWTIMCESADRSGFVRGTLASREGLRAEVPALREPPLLSMADMGMDHSAMQHAGARDEAAERSKTSRY